jgi:hypothetical protein
MNAIAYNYFIPFAVGFSTFLLAAGISAIRHGALPRWLPGARSCSASRPTPGGLHLFA